jgi:hypothetical protein
MHSDCSLPQLEKYLKLDQKGSIMAEYIWIDGSNGVRSKTKVGLISPFVPSTLPHSARVSLVFLGRPAARKPQSSSSHLRGR